LEQALQINDDLFKYAKEKAQLIRLDKPDEARQVIAAGVAGVTDLGRVGE
jgi:hypothetical protein